MIADYFKIPQFCPVNCSLHAVRMLCTNAPRESPMGLHHVSVMVTRCVLHVWVGACVRVRVCVRLHYVSDMVSGHLQPQGPCSGACDVLVGRWSVLVTVGAADCW